jgi:hypothetical protein
MQKELENSEKGFARTGDAGIRRWVSIQRYRKYDRIWVRVRYVRYGIWEWM